MLARYMFTPAAKAKVESWTYNPNGKTEDEKWQDGDKVRWESCSLGSHSVNRVTIEAGAFHGKTCAKSDYFYRIELGRGEFLFYHGEDDEKPDKVSVEQGDCIRVRKGTFYDYQARHQNLVATFFMESC